VTETVYPWQMPMWQRLQQARRTGRLHHALLISGVEGLGKSRFVEQLAQSLLCQSPDAEGAACDTCRSCRYFKAGTHPDFQRLEPEGDGKPIRIDTIRELSEWSVKTSQEGGNRVAIIAPAERMNRAAANSLLKTLEEPVPGNHLLLVSAQPALLPATVRSRCQHLSFVPPVKAEAIAWLVDQEPEQPWPLLLGLAKGAPLKALELARNDALEARARAFSNLDAVWSGGADPLALAAEWCTDSVRVVDWLGSWLRDMVRLRFGVPQDGLENPDLAPALQAKSQRLDLKALLRIEEQLKAGAQAWQRANLNIQMQMEDLVIALMEIRR